MTVIDLARLVDSLFVKEFIAAIPGVECGIENLNNRKQ